MFSGSPRHVSLSAELQFLNSRSEKQAESVEIELAADSLLSSRGELVHDRIERDAEFALEVVV